MECSEKFYKNCIAEELLVAQTKPSSRDELKKINEILKRINESDAVGSSFDLNDSLETEEQIDSDDDVDDDFDEDILTRLQGININDSDKVWQQLTVKERKEFQQLVESGDIMELIPAYEPWWCLRKNSKIVEISQKPAKEEKPTVMPHIAKKIQKFSTIYKKTPSPCLHYNLWNILTAYTCTVRFFSGEHQTSSVEASTHVVSLSANLKSNANFDDAEQAISSVQFESISENINIASEDKKQLQSDAKQIMTIQMYKLAALSDLLNLFRTAKDAVKQRIHLDSEFSQQFDLGCGTVELTKSRLNQLIKKIEFFLSYVCRDDDYDQNMT